MSAADGMTLWTGDYLADTAHFSTIQHGAYMLILMAMWRSGGRLPNKESRLASAARLTVDKWRKVGAEIMELLTVEGEFVTQKRLRLELKKTIGRIEKNKSAGSAGGTAKALKTKKPDLANATVSLDEKDSDALALGLGLGKEESKQKEKKIDKRRTKPHPIPDDWQPKLSHFQAAQALNLPAGFVERKAEDMRLWAQSTGKLKANWDATFTGILRREAENRPKGSNPQQEWLSAIR